MMEISFQPFPALSSERLVLREISTDDADSIYALRSDAVIMRYINRPLAKSKDDILQFIHSLDEMLAKNECINWAITLKGEEDRLLGMICLLRMQPENFRTELGYILHPDARGQGIMQEAVKRVIEYAFSALKFHSIEAVIDNRNQASARVLDATGFSREGFFKDKTFYNGEFQDVAIYSLLQTK